VLCKKNGGGEQSHNTKKTTKRTKKIKNQIFLLMASTKREDISLCLGLFILAEVKSEDISDLPILFSK
jgi:hypothetical protein